MTTRCMRRGFQEGIAGRCWRGPVECSILKSRSRQTVRTRRQHEYNNQAAADAIRAVPAGAGAGLGARRCESFQSLGTGVAGRHALGDAPLLLLRRQAPGAAAAVRRGGHRALAPGHGGSAPTATGASRPRPGAAIRWRPSRRPSTCSTPARCSAWPKPSRPTPRPRPACASRSSNGWRPRRPATTWPSMPRRRRRRSKPRARASPRACRTC